MNKAILDLLSRPLPRWFYVENVPEELRYSIYPAKFCGETWEELKSQKLAEPIGDGFETSAPLGLTIMSLLADCCAGAHKRLVTDEAASYSALDRYLATIGGADLGKFGDKSERLVTISLKIMNFKNVPLSRLVGLREKEKTASGAHLTALRHSYLKRVEDYSDKLTLAKTKPTLLRSSECLSRRCVRILIFSRTSLKTRRRRFSFRRKWPLQPSLWPGPFLNQLLGWRSLEAHYTGKRLNTGPPGTKPFLDCTSLVALGPVQAPFCDVRFRQCLC